MKGLRFTSDDRPGIRRIKRGAGFLYLTPSGRRVSNPATLARIRKLAIPPAYRDVWICPDPQGHLQATGRDARGRKQYRYHRQWRAHRDAAKFDHVLEFARALPLIRRRVAHDLRRPGLPRERVLATLVKLLESTLVRIGNEAYARANGSFGLTTLRNRHVDVRGPELCFEFRAKSGIQREVRVHDPALARIVRRCADIPGQELFQWIDESGERHRIDSTGVNEYLREASGGPFTAKDYRTWFATLEMLERLRGRAPASARAAKREIGAALAEVAERLGNTPAICRKCYIHPEVIAAYAEGRLARVNGAAPAATLGALLRRKRNGRSHTAAQTARIAPQTLRSRAEAPGHTRLQTER